jgi:hypothetical protein
MQAWDVDTLLAALPRDAANWDMRDGEMVAVRGDRQSDPSCSGPSETLDVARIGLWAERRVFANSRDFYLALLT